jgi:hypothetical protein
MSQTLMPSLTQLIHQGPVLAMYLVGMVLALAFWRRHPTPCLLLFAATGLLFVLGVVQPLLFQYVAQSRSGMGWQNATVAQAVGIFGLVASGLRALALGLLFAAVFVGRGPADPYAMKALPYQ